MTDLIQAIAELRRVTPPNSPWEAGDLSMGSSPVDYHIATILNAVASGELIPATERDAAVAAALVAAARLLDQRIEDLVADHGSYEADTNVTNLPEWVETAEEELEPMAKAILALINQPQADALARVRAEAVKVKPLVWRFFDVEHSFGKGVYDANSIGHTYTIQDCGKRDFPMTFYVSAISASFAELSDAKSAAQADHNARILSALQVKP